MTRVPIRVHGPWLHRKRWRLDVFVNGERTKRSFATYGEALLAAHEIATGVGNRSGNTSGSGLDERSDVATRNR